jgi:hypothetical protein
MADKVKLGPPASSTVGKVKLGPSPSSDDRIFRASSSWRAKLVEVIDPISSNEDSDDVMPPPRSYRYDVGSDEEDNNNVLPPLPSSPECLKHKAPVTDCSDKKV